MARTCPEPNILLALHVANVQFAVVVTQPKVSGYDKRPDMPRDGIRRIAFQADARKREACARIKSSACSVARQDKLLSRCRRLTHRPPLEGRGRPVR